MDLLSSSIFLGLSFIAITLLLGFIGVIAIVSLWCHRLSVKTQDFRRSLIDNLISLIKLSD